MTHYIQPLLVICALACGFAFGWFVDDDKGQLDTRAEVDEVETKTLECQTRYKRLLKTKRIMIPVPVYNVTDCETELETCEGALQAIKLWCDPECKQQLGECLDALRAAQDCNVSYYSYRRPI